MSPKRKGRFVFALFVLAMLLLIGRNGYRRYQRAALFRAAEQGDTQHLKFLLRQGVDVNMVNRYADDNKPKIQESPLLVAARTKHWEAVHLLLQSGADARFHDGGESPLGFALDDDKEDIVQELLHHHAGPNSKGMGGDPVLFSALRTQNGSLIQATLDAGADPNVVDGQGNTALNIAVGTDYGASHPGSHISKLNLVRLLVAHGADVNARRSAYKYTPLMSAVITGNKEVVHFLLAQEALTNAKLLPSSPSTAPVTTALRLARQSNHPDIVKLLLQAGAKE